MATTRMSHEHIKTTLRGQGLPVPAGTLVDARWLARHDDWYVKTTKGWLWWNAHAKAWKPTTYGP